jgi:hypothetical protein
VIRGDRDELNSIAGGAIKVELKVHQRVGCERRAEDGVAHTHTSYLERDSCSLG